MLAWRATGHGTDANGHDAPATGETVNGAIDVIHPATSLTPDPVNPTKVDAGDPVTIKVTEKNTGDDPLTASVVAGRHLRRLFSPASLTLAPTPAGLHLHLHRPGRRHRRQLDARRQGRQPRGTAPTPASSQGGVIVIRPATSLYRRPGDPTKVYAGTPSRSWSPRRTPATTR